MTPPVETFEELLQRALEIARREKETNVSEDDMMILSCALLALYQRWQDR